MALEDYRAEMERCSQCSYCWYIPLDQIKSWRFSKGCPSVAYNHFNSYSARGRYSVSLSLLKGNCEYSPTLLDIAYMCQTCGSCDVACKVCRYNLEPLEAIHELRARLVEDGQVLPQHLAAIESLRQESNMMLQPHGVRSRWAEGLDFKDISKGEKAEFVFFAGCKSSYHETFQKTARSSISILKNAGVDIGIMGQDESCCGARAYSMGYREDFSSCAATLIERWTKAGVRTIVTPCADCYHAFKRLYPKMGSQFNVLHTVEFINQLVKEDKVKFTKTLPMTVTYHDPCHLGRGGEPYVPWEGVEKKIRKQVIVYEPKKPRYNGAWGVYEPPRNILKSIPGIELVEMERIREYAWCCGAGGGVREGYPQFSQWTASERIEEAKSVGAEAIVSACPWCEDNFTDAVEAMDEKLKVLDLIDLVSQAL